MKKLIAISVVFALAAGVAFAVDIGGTVFGRVNVIEGTFQEGTDAEVKASGAFDRVRVDGGGEVADGKFGGYIRLQGDGTPGVDSANAWWKPIDQFKLIIGNNSDGFWGKEGVTGWGFNQMPYDGGVAVNGGIWYGTGWGSSIYGSSPMFHNRYTFFGGFGDKGALLEIKPFDVLGINIAIPFFEGGEAAKVFSHIVAQVDLNFSFGNIALTYKGGQGYNTTINDPSDDPSALFLYYGGSFDAISIDFGLSYHFPKEDNTWNQPIGLGLGFKYAADAFGVKFRITTTLGGDDKTTYINTSVLPYYAINDNISIFLNMGLGIQAPDVGDALVGFYVNPYLRVGAEWGPTFYVGLQLYTDGVFGPNDKAKIALAIPVSLMVSF